MHLIIPRARQQEVLSNGVVCVSVCQSVCLSASQSVMDKEIVKQLRYAVIHSEKGTKTFALFWEGHSADSAIHDLLKLQTLHFLFLIIELACSAPLVYEYTALNTWHTSNFV